jgi:hypothetical protein
MVAVQEIAPCLWFDIQAEEAVILNNIPAEKPGSTPPNKPTTPAKPDENPDPTKPKPGGNEPGKNDPTRIEEPQKTDPTRIDEPPLPKPGQPNPVTPEKK